MPGALRERWTITSINPFPKTLRVAATRCLRPGISCRRTIRSPRLYNVILSPPVVGSSGRQVCIPKANL